MLKLTLSNHEKSVVLFADGNKQLHRRDYMKAVRETNCKDRSHNCNSTRTVKDEAGRTYKVLTDCTIVLAK